MADLKEITLEILATRGDIQLLEPIDDGYPLFTKIPQFVTLNRTKHPSYRTWFPKQNVIVKFLKQEDYPERVLLLPPETTLHIRIVNTAIPPFGHYFGYWIGQVLKVYDENGGEDSCG